jgi:hypothetical protein
MKPPLHLSNEIGQEVSSSMHLCGYKFSSDLLTKFQYLLQQLGSFCNIICSTNLKQANRKHNEKTRSYLSLKMVLID